MNDSQEILQRIKFVTNARTQVEMAAALEIGQSSVSDAIRRKSIPSEWLITVHDKYGVNLNWLRTGVGPIESMDKPQASRNLENAFALAPELPEHRAFLFKNPFMLSEAPQEIGGMETRVLSTFCPDIPSGGMPAFSTRAIITLPANLIAQGTLVFYLESASMEPTLRKNAYVGVSTSVKSIVSGEIYALLMPHEGVAFRRVMQESEGETFVLCFDAPGLPVTHMPVATLQARIVGKVAWILQMV